MVWIAKWLSVPVLVIAVAIWCSTARWFENDWIVAAFGVTGMLSLFVWQRAAFRLVPSFCGSNRHDDLEPSIRKRITSISFSTLIASVLVMLIALLIIVLLPVRDQSGITMALTVMVVTSYSKFGVMRILVRRMLDRESMIVADR